MGVVYWGLLGKVMWVGVSVSMVTVSMVTRPVSVGERLLLKAVSISVQWVVESGHID